MYREKKDTVEKEFLSFPDIAADTLNVLLYFGKSVETAENLQPGPTETIYQGKEKLRSQYEDVGKYIMGDGHIIRMYLIANQTKTDGRMLLRKAGYIGGIYREQYDGKIADIFPVIEIVLYWGKSRWRGSRDLRHLFRKHKLSAEGWNYIDDLQLHVFEMRYLPEETRKLFRSDMRIVVDFLAGEDLSGSRRKVIHKAALLRMLYVLSGGSDRQGIEEWIQGLEIREEDEVMTFELFDRYKREGIQEGERSGDAKRLVADIDKVMEKLQLSLEKACELFEVTVSSYEEAKKLV